jgi:NaMN:DMB phosphoribosyltransferase
VLYGESTVGIENVGVTACSICVVHQVLHAIAVVALSDVSTRVTDGVARVTVHIIFYLQKNNG